VDILHLHQRAHSRARIFSPATPNKSTDGFSAAISRAKSPPWRSPDASPATIIILVLGAGAIAASAGGVSTLILIAQNSY